MAYPQARSMNGDLNEGATDGKYKKVINDRGGRVGATTYAERRDLNDNWFGIHETPDKVIPGRDSIAVTPNYVPTAPTPGDVSP